MYIMSLTEIKNAVVLFSGGLDSTTCIAIAKEQGFECYALTIDYGQSHVAEVNAAERIVKVMQVKEHKTIKIGLSLLGGSALTDVNIPVPEHTGDGNIPITYVPARNTIFLSVALAYAEVLGATDIFYGANAIDYSGYPDCRPDYIEAFEKVATLATRAGREGVSLRVHAPLLHLYKAEIIREGKRLGVDYGMTISCYQINEQGRACGVCDSCHYRRKGFIEAGVADPTQYVSR
jgi:7-cyano-7-deazaguanine synthase